MNRFAYVEARLSPNESFVSRDNKVKIYDGDNKVGRILHLESRLGQTVFLCFSDRV